MPGFHSKKQKRQARHVIASEEKRGRSKKEAERIGWATVHARKSLIGDVEETEILTLDDAHDLAKGGPGAHGGAIDHYTAEGRPVYVTQVRHGVKRKKRRAHVLEREAERVEREQEKKRARAGRHKKKSLPLEPDLEKAIFHGKIGRTSSGKAVPKPSQNPVGSKNEGQVSMRRYERATADFDHVDHAQAADMHRAQASRFAQLEAVHRDFANATNSSPHHAHADKYGMAKLAHETITAHHEREHRYTKDKHYGKSLDEDLPLVIDPDLEKADLHPLPPSPEVAKIRAEHHARYGPSEAKVHATHEQLQHHVGLASHDYMQGTAHHEPHLHEAARQHAVALAEQHHVVTGKNNFPHHGKAKYHREQHNSAMSRAAHAVEKEDLQGVHHHVHEALYHRAQQVAHDQAGRARTKAKKTGGMVKAIYVAGEARETFGKSFSSLEKAASEATLSIPGRVRHAHPDNMAKVAQRHVRRMGLSREEHNARAAGHETATYRILSNHKHGRFEDEHQTRQLSQAHSHMAGAHRAAARVLNKQKLRHGGLPEALPKSFLETSDLEKALSEVEVLLQKADPKNLSYLKVHHAAIRHHMAIAQHGPDSQQAMDSGRSLRRSARRHVSGIYATSADHRGIAQQNLRDVAKHVSHPHMQSASHALAEAHLRQARKEEVTERGLAQHAAEHKFGKVNVAKVSPSFDPKDSSAKTKVEHANRQLSSAKFEGKKSLGAEDLEKATSHGLHIPFGVLRAAKKYARVGGEKHAKTLHEKATAHVGKVGATYLPEHHAALRDAHQSAAFHTDRVFDDPKGVAHIALAGAYHHASGSGTAKKSFTDENVGLYIKENEMSKYDDLFKSELDGVEDKVLISCPHCDEPITKSQVLEKARGKGSVGKMPPHASKTKVKEKRPGKGASAHPPVPPGLKKADACSGDSSDSDSREDASEDKMSKGIQYYGSPYHQWADPSGDAALAKMIEEGKLDERLQQPSHMGYPKAVSTR